MEFDTWDEFEGAVLGVFGPQLQDEAMEQLRLGVNGAYGPEPQAEYDEFVGELQAGLTDGTLSWVGAPAPAAGGVDPDDLAAEESLHDAMDALEGKIGRTLTDGEVDQLLTEIPDAALKGNEIDLVTDHADALKAKVADHDGRLEIGAAAAQRVREGHDTGFDARQLDGMSERELRVFRGEQAARFAREGGSPEEWTAAKEAALADENGSVDHSADDEGDIRREVHAG